PALIDRPTVVAGTKADLVPDAVEAARGVLGDDAVPVSGVTGEGLEELGRRIGSAVRDAKAATPEPEPYVVLRPARERFVVRREGERFRVVGRDVERWVAATDF